MTFCFAAFCALAMAAPTGTPDAPRDPGAAIADPVIPPAAIDDTLEVTGESVKARQVSTRMTIGVMVNGRGPFRFMVDSGADRSVMGAGLAQQLALPPGRPITLYSMAGRSMVGTVKVARLEFGRSEIRDLATPALSEAHLGAQGLLGIDAMSGQRVMFDFDAKTITVQDTRRPPPRSSADEIVVTARRRKGQLIITEAKVDNRGIFAVIDSGAEITIGNSALRNALFRRNRKPAGARRTTLISVTGQTLEADLVAVPELTIGKLTLRNLTIAFADSPPFALFGLAQTPAVLLGTDVLEVFHRVSLDFRNRKIRFLLRR